MPRRSKGARLYWRSDREIWEIRDTGQRISTCTASRGEAEIALAVYITRRGIAAEMDPDRVREDRDDPALQETPHD